MAADAIVRNFEIIGEAVSQIPEEIREQYPEVEWQEARTFRNILTHHYFKINIETVWDTIQNNLPDFKKHIEQAYSSEASDG